jgi:hypothetical protein
MPELSVIEWAKREKISKQAAYKRLELLKIKPNAKGKIDADQVTKRWAGSQNEVQRQNSQQQKSALQKRATPGSPKPETQSGQQRAEPDKQGPSLADFQTALAALKVKDKKLDIEEREGTLVLTEDVRAEWSRMALAAKGKFQNLGSELAQRLADEPDPIRCREMIDERVNAALSELAIHE